LDRGQIRRIVDLQIQGLARQLADSDLVLVVTETARDQIAVEGYDPTYGARPLKRVIQQQIQNPLATEILRGQFAPGSGVRIDCLDGQFTFERLDAGESQTLAGREVSRV
jgi:ATP-dependent Clp protease ATP-binding subunit ClpB